MGHGACIFGELRGAQHAYVFDTFDGAGRRVGAQVHAEFLVAEDRQAFFQAQLEPVAAGDAVAAPVMEVFVAHHTFDVGKVHVRGSGLAGQHELGVEDVQALVLHRAHVEVAGGDDHETFQVQRQAEAGFVPGHRRHQRIHRMFGLIEVTRAHVDLQQVLLAVACGDALLACHQLAGHEGEQVGGFFVRIHPLGEVAAIFEVTAVHQVAVAQQHWVLGLVGAQCDGVAGHHVRAVQEVGDTAETLGFTLGEERVVADVQAHQLGVFSRAAGGEDFEVERAFFCRRQVVQHQLAAVELERCALAVDQHACQVQLVAVQAQGLNGHIRVAAQRHLVEDAGFCRVEVEAELDRVDPERRGGVVRTVDHRGLSFTHEQHGGSPKSSIARVRCSRARR